LKETIYTAHATARQSVREFFQIAADLPQAFRLGYRLARRNVAAQYRQSVLGLFWTVLPPLANALVWIFLHTQQVVRLEEALPVSYPVFVFTGTLLWQLFSRAILAVLNSPQSNKLLLSKVNFPREALLFSALFEILFNAIITGLIIIIMLLLYGVPLGVHTLLTLFGIVGIILLGMAIGLWLFPLSMLYRDVALGLPIILQFAMYLTPVVYPTPTYTGWAKILQYNPISPVLETTRNWMLNMPAGSPYLSFVLVLSISSFLLLIGIVLYRLSMTIIIERIGS
jgi:lipopolysaccharide transport system permease protein